MNDLEPVAAKPHELSNIERLAADPSFDVQKLQTLVTMHEHAQDRAAKIAFNRAMVAAQAELRPVEADASNPQTRSKYASYNALDRACRPIYSKHGFALSYDTGQGPTTLPIPEGHIRVLCYVMHHDGGERTYQKDEPADGKGAKGNDVMTRTHAGGSALAYGKRYLLKAIFNIAEGEDDDDGNKAGGAKTTPMTKDHQADITWRCEQIGPDMLPKVLRSYKVKTLEEIPEIEHASIVSRLIKAAEAAEK